MFKFLKRKKDQKPQDTNVEPQNPQINEDVSNVPSEENSIVESASAEKETPTTEEVSKHSKEQEALSLETPPQEKEEKKPSLFKRLTNSLSKTRNNLTSGLANIFLGKKVIDDELLEDIENLLITSDIGVDAAEELVLELTKGVSRKEIKDPQAVLSRLKSGLFDIIRPCEHPLVIDDTKQPFVILMIGVNGSGKTTTIGKLANKYMQEGKKVMLAAGDTFRAAAVEQLQVWGTRSQVPVIAQHTGADSASVAFDALSSAKAKQIDVLIIDTAGRLHTQSNLMEELKKVKRVLSKQEGSAPHEVMLVLDAGIGQNALAQAEKFNEAIGLDSVTITKLDGTAKGGMLFAIAKKLKLPIRFIGCGEKIEDLREFHAQEFIDALFVSEDNE